MWALHTLKRTFKSYYISKLYVLLGVRLSVKFFANSPYARSCWACIQDIAATLSRRSSETSMYSKRTTKGKRWVVRSEHAWNASLPPHRVKLRTNEWVQTVRGDGSRGGGGSCACEQEENNNILRNVLCVLHNSWSIQAFADVVSASGRPCDIKG